MIIGTVISDVMPHDYWNHGSNVRPHVSYTNEEKTSDHSSFVISIPPAFRTTEFLRRNKPVRRPTFHTVTLHLIKAMPSGDDVFRFP